MSNWLSRWWTGDRFFEDRRSRVTSDGDTLRIEYHVNSTDVTWTGKDDGHGHFDMTAPGIQGTAHLHRSLVRPDVIEGWYREKWPGHKMEEGMWQLSRTG